MKKGDDRYILPWFSGIVKPQAAEDLLDCPAVRQIFSGEIYWMHKIWFVAACCLCFIIFIGIGGCARKNVRNLASDVCLLTPERSTKEQVLAYLGQPDERYEMKDGSEVWIYYDVRKTALSDTPYIGNKIGKKNYETAKLTFRGDIVMTCVYRLLDEKEFEQGDLVK